MPAGERDDHAHSTQDTSVARLAAAAPGCRGLHPVGHGRSPDAGAHPRAYTCNGGGALWLPGLAAHHALRQLPVPDPAHPQRPADPHGPSSAVLERPLHPRHEWLRLTPVEVPKDRVWTAKDDSRHLSPWIGLPGYRHTVGMARHWHFLSVLFWVGNGVAFVVLLGENANAFRGGFRLWEETGERKASVPSICHGSSRTNKRPQKAIS